MVVIFIDTFFRFSGVALLLLLAGLVVRDVKSANSTKYLIGLCLTVAATLLGYTPEFLSLPKPLFVLMRTLDIPNVIFVWLFGLSLFNDKFEMRAQHWALALLYCLPVIVLRLQQFGVTNGFPKFGLVGVDIIAFLLMAHLFVVIVRGKDDDLLEARRRSRFYFVSVLAIIVCFFAVADIALGTRFAPLVPTLKAMIALPGIIGGAHWLLNISPNALIFENRERRKETELSFSDKQLFAKLEAEMVEKQAYLEPGISIETLAIRLGSTPYKLRYLINSRLGYRHFSAYVNSMRIEAVKRDFLNSEKNEIPILTIALNSGFNPLSPFNRAFKAQEGVTPSEFRARFKSKNPYA